MIHTYISSQLQDPIRADPLKLRKLNIRGITRDFLEHSEIIQG